MKYIYFIILAFLSFQISAQQPASSSLEIEKGLQQKELLTKNSLVKNLPFKNIGPTIMSGRVTDLAVNPKNPVEFYVGYASGGVWYTNNNGTSFSPVLDNSPTQNVGCLAVDWDSKTIWVGTGEVNASRSSYAGIGILKSSNQGKTWENIGLLDSHHISNIIVNPANINEIVVGVVGHLYSTNKERGVYKTNNGGKTWTNTLFVDDQSGIIELEVSPSNFNVMYASSWDKDRKSWNFRGNGEGSAIYKSMDAGSNWVNITEKGSGFPTGEGVGRIGLAIYDDYTLYAIHDNQERREDKYDKKKKEGLTKEDFKTITNAQFLELDDKSLSKYLKSNRFPEKYSASSIKKNVKNGTVKPIDLARYLEDANSLLFDTPVIGAEVYKSTDGGKSWNKTHEGFLDDIYYSYGYYFGKVHVDPSNKDAIYIYGVPILKSKNGGKSFVSINGDNVHSDHHMLWINPEMPGHLINGNDGGVNISYDDGTTWIKNNTPSVGQFYAINVDNEKPYNVYGGLQDNGVWVGPHTNEEDTYWKQSGQYPYEAIMGGDGMQIQIDSRNSNIVYTGFQFGNYFRLNRETDEQTYIQPKHELGESPYRFNWQTPILLSPHNQDILYLGGNKLMRSMNQGNDWDAISEDLTKGGKKGNVAYGTIASISESPFQFGLLYTGSDDGVVSVTKNGGGSWTTISGTFLKNLWVSRVIASQHKKERVYVTLNGYRWDDFKPYVYVSENYGATWENISSNLPTSSINVIKEDPKNEKLLYLGTDNGAYVSFNKGKSWEAFSNGLPNVAFHDIVIQTEENDLLLGTHGRSIYLSNISLLQNIEEDKKVINDIESLRASSRWGSSWSQWGKTYEPSIDVQFFNPKAEKVTISIQTEDGTELNNYQIDADKGVNVFEYDVTVSEKGKKAMAKKDQEISEAKNGNYYLPKGNYSIDINGNKKEFVVK